MLPCDGSPALPSAPRGVDLQPADDTHANAFAQVVGAEFAALNRRLDEQEGAIRSILEGQRVLANMIDGNRRVLEGITQNLDMLIPIVVQLREAIQTDERPRDESDPFGVAHLRDGDS